MEPIPLVVQEEIALEGLDGITLDTLWFRLSERLKLPLPFREKFKNNLWQLVIKDDDYEYFKIQNPRKTPQRLNRQDMFTNESISEVEIDKILKDSYYIYTYHPVDDPVIRGSCSEFKTREKFDRNQLEDMNSMEIEEKYGNTLVIVASQKTRNSVLIPTNIGRDNDINNQTYCILERIGRSRYFGEATSGPFSLNDFVNDSKLLHYFRRQLMKNMLVEKQTIQQKLRGKVIQVQLFHLPKYFELIQVTSKCLTEKLFQFLLTLPYHAASNESARNHLGINQKSFRNFTRSKLGIFETGAFPYRVIYPNAKEEEYFNKAKREEKNVNGVKLIDPNIDIYSLYAEEKEDEIEEDSGFLNTSNQIFKSSLIWQVLKKLEEVGPQGMSQTEIGTYFGLSGLNARAICRKIQKDYGVTIYLNDEGRQRTSMYVHKNYKNQKAKEIVQQVEKLIRKADETSNSLQAICNENLTQQNNDSDTKVSIPLNLLKTLETQEEFNISDIIGNVSNESFSITLNDSSPFESVHDVQVNMNFLNNLPGIKKSSKGIADAIANNKVSPKLLNRMNLVLDVLKEKHFVEANSLLITLRRKESDLKELIDRKSMYTICTQLAADNFLKVIEIELKSQSKTIKSIYFGEHNVTLDMRCWHSVIEELKLIYFSKEITMRDEEYFNSNSVVSPISFESKTTEPHEEFSAQSMKHVINVPKFQKLKLLHEFLYYLIYDYPSDYQKIPIKTAIETWKNVNQNITDIEMIATNFSTCYSTEFNWKMFVPPLIAYRDYGTGWALLKDIINRIPLILYVKFTRFAGLKPDVEKYLEHPIKRNFLLHFLPQKMRIELLKSRKYVFLLIDLCKRLCFLGLAQMGPQRTHQIDYTYFYLNRNASLLDTTSNDGMYIQVENKVFPKIEFKFATSSDVLLYWNKLMEICLTTKIGKENSPDMNENIVDNIENRIVLQDSLAIQTAEKAPQNDLGIIPGDHRGVAGLDSSLCAHLKINWSRESIKSVIRKLRKRSMSILTRRKERAPKMPRKATSGGGRIKKEKTKKTIVRKIVKNVLPKKKGPSKAEMLTGMHFMLRTTPIIRKPSTEVKKKKSIVLDDVDKKALEMQENQRVTWSDMEDKTVILIKAAMKFLFASDSQCNHYCPSKVIRDILHWRSEKSLTKTTAACKRRILYLIKNKTQFKKKVEMYAEQLSSKPDFEKKYSNFIEKLKKQYGKDVNLQNIVKIHIVELVYQMHQMFYKQYLNIHSIRGDENFIILPNDYRDVLDKFKLIYPTDSHIKFLQKEPENLNEIEISTISSLVHSAMCCAKDRTNIQYFLLEAYKKFNENDLTKALNQMRHQQVISFNKGPRISEASSNNKTRYRLANRYSTQLSSIPISTDIYSEFFETVKNLSQLKEEQYQIRNITCGMIFMLSEFLKTNKISFVFERPDKLIMVDPSLKKTTFDKISDDYDAARMKEDENEKKNVENKHVRFHPDSNSDEKFYFYEDPVEIFLKLDSFYLHVFCILYVLEKGEDLYTYNWSIHDEECSLKNCVMKLTEDMEIELQKIACYCYETVRALVNNEPIPWGSEQEKNDKLITKNSLIKFFDKEIAKNSSTMNSSGNMDIGKKTKNMHSQITTKTILNYILTLATDFEQDDDAWLTDYKKISHKTSEQLSDDEDEIDPIKHSKISHQLKDLNVSMRSSTSFVVNLPTISIRIEGEKSEHIFIDDETFDKRLIEFNEATRVHVIENIKRNHIYMPDVLQKRTLKADINSISYGNSAQLTEICQLIIAKQAEGIKASDLLERFYDKKELTKNIEALINNKIIIRVGVNEIRFVHRNFSLKWLVSTFYLTEELQEDSEGEKPSKKARKDDNDEVETKRNLHQNPYYVIPAPWIRIGPINRVINRRCLDKWLSTIFNYILLNPGIYLINLRNKFNVLNVFQVRLLCEILQDIGCVQLKSHCQIDVDIFSEYQNDNLTSEPATHFDTVEQTYVDTLPDAFQKLAMFIGKKMYKTPFL